MIARARASVCCLRVAFAGVMALLLMSSRALACPVCFGQSDSPMASAANWSIFAMLAITGSVLAGFAAFFIHLIRRARAAGAEQDFGAEPGFGAEPRLLDDYGDTSRC